MTKLAKILVLLGLLNGVSTSVSASDTLHKTLVQKYPAPQLEAVSSREYKFLLDAAQLPSDVRTAFDTLWTTLPKLTHEHGFSVRQGSKNAFRIDESTKEYFDTPDQQLWKRGYLIRVTTKLEGGLPASSKRSLTVKAIHDDIAKVLNTPLNLKPGKSGEVETGENLGYTPGGRLGSYIEKGVTIAVSAKKLEQGATVGTFARWIPELAELGIPLTTPLVSRKVFAYRCKPGSISSSALPPAKITFEAWARDGNAGIEMFDVSFSSDTKDYYGAGSAFAEGERLMGILAKAWGSGGPETRKGLGGADWDRWGGSKVRKLMDRPVGKTQ